MNNEFGLLRKKDLVEFEQFAKKKIKNLKYYSGVSFHLLILK